MSRNQRTTLLALVVVVVIVGFVVARAAGGGGSSSTTAAGTTTVVPTVVVRHGKPVGGVKKLDFPKGGTIDFKVRSDVADEVHFHGYDVHRDVPAGGTVRFRVPAKFDGRFVVELERHGEQIAEVEVTP